MFQKLAKELYVAAKSGDSDPNNNAALRMVVEKAKAENMPKANIESAIQKAASKGASEIMKQLGMRDMDLMVLLLLLML